MEYNQTILRLKESNAMTSKIRIITNEHQEELKEHGTYEFPVLVSDEALSRFYTGSFQWAHGN